MKTWIDKLRETPLELLESMVEQQKRDIEIKQRDLQTMERVLAEHSANRGHE